MRALIVRTARAIVLVLVLAAAAAGVFAWRFFSRVERVEPDPARGFLAPYRLFLPRSLEDGPDGLHLLVLPNNTGRADDDPAVHDRKALLRAFAARGLAERLHTPMLVPSFPRPASQWQVYTHALDRDTMTTGIPELARLDLQLVAMIDDARARIATQTGRQVDARVLIAGFSANGMFANRFALLHPERVLAAAAGSPGGWPLAPLAEWNGRRLRYPIGLDGVDAWLGAPADHTRQAALRILIYQGSEDRNDSLAFGDGWDPEDRAVVDELFGDELPERFETARRLYADTVPGAVFRLHPGVGHERTAQMDEEVAAFFESALVEVR